MRKEHTQQSGLEQQMFYMLQLRSSDEYYAKQTSEWPAVESIDKKMKMVSSGT